MHCVSVTEIFLSNKLNEIKTKYLFINTTIYNVKKNVTVIIKKSSNEHLRNVVVFHTLRNVNYKNIQYMIRSTIIIFIY